MRCTNTSSLSWISFSVVAVHRFSVHHFLYGVYIRFLFVYITFCQWIWNMYMWTLNTLTILVRQIYRVLPYPSHTIHHQMHYSRFPFEFVRCLDFPLFTSVNAEDVGVCEWLEGLCVWFCVRSKWDSSNSICKPMTSLHLWNIIQHSAINRPFYLQLDKNRSRICLTYRT